MSIQSIIANFVIRRQFKNPKAEFSVPKARHLVNKLAEKYPPPPPDVKHTPVAADAAKGLCPAEWLSVANPQRTVLYFHGGGYFFCGLTTHRPVSAYLARVAQARVLSVDYRMAPEHPCPAAVEDTVAWWKALLAEGLDRRRPCSRAIRPAVGWPWPPCWRRASRASLCRRAACCSRPGPI